MIRRRVVVHGLVQGVFFRDTLRRHALQRDVSGWAGNNADGTVEAVFEGDAEDVEALVTISHKGPRGARVDRLEVVDEEPEGISGFEVL